MLTIHSNGSKWGGEQPDSIEELIGVLSAHALDPRFEDYGNFAYTNPESATTEEVLFEGVRFFGNFYELSHGFRIDTDEPNIIDKLTNAIRANQATLDYQQAKDQIARYKQQAEEAARGRVSKEEEKQERLELARLQRKYKAA